VNKLDDPITVCIGGYDLTIRNAFGMGIGVSLNSFLGPGCEKYVIPGAEVLAGKNYVPLSGWSLPLPPGRYLVEATVRTYPDMGEPFYGRARVLIVIVPPL